VFALSHHAVYFLEKFHAPLFGTLHGREYWVWMNRAVLDNISVRLIATAHLPSACWRQLPRGAFPYAKGNEYYRYL
jgi:hypothetical protein